MKFTLACQAPAVPLKTRLAFWPITIPEPDALTLVVALFESQIYLSFVVITEALINVVLPAIKRAPSTSRFPTILALFATFNVVTFAVSVTFKAYALTNELA